MRSFYGFVVYKWGFWKCFNFLWRGGYVEITTGISCLCYLHPRRNPYQPTLICSLTEGHSHFFYSGKDRPGPREIPFLIENYILLPSMALLSLLLYSALRWSLARSPAPPVLAPPAESANNKNHAVLFPKNHQPFGRFIRSLVLSFCTLQRGRWVEPKLRRTCKKWFGRIRNGTKSVQFIPKWIVQKMLWAHGNSEERTRDDDVVGDQSRIVGEWSGMNFRNSGASRFLIKMGIAYRVAEGMSSNWGAQRMKLFHYQKPLWTLQLYQFPLKRIWKLIN